MTWNMADRGFSLISALHELADMVPDTKSLPYGAVIVKCSLEVFTQIQELAKETADAIEELSKKRDAACWGCKCEKLESRWIPVTERLPEDRSDVLVYLKYEVGGRIAAANYDKGTWQDCVMGGLYRTEEGVVTHWMPIPQPPKEEET